MIANESINRAIEYILSHINDELSVDMVANHCHFSRYHLSRMFKAEAGEGIGEFIKRTKMEQSAFRLKVERDRSVTEIGVEYGYSSSNYSSAFKQHHDLSPVKFRDRILDKSLNNPVFSDASVHLESFEACDKKISIEVLEDMTAVYHRHKGNYEDLSRHWDEFQKKYGEYISEDTLFLERTYDDPSITAADECLYDLYMTVPEDCGLPNTCVVKGGKYAVYHFDGPVKQIYTAYQNIFNVWLPESGHKMDDRYSFDIYRRIDCDAMDMKIDICIPIK
jgi:AraC family transcriptional regulator